MQQITIDYLKIINEKIKFQPTRDQGLKELMNIQIEEISVGLEIYGWYLFGKYHELQSKIEDRIYHLEKASHYYDLIFVRGAQSCIQVRNPKYYFKRAHIYYQLSLADIDNPEFDELLDRAKRLMNLATNLFPNNSSINFLQTRIAEIY